MKCRITYTVEMTDEQLFALGHYYDYGSGRKATRDEVKRYFHNTQTQIWDIEDEYTRYKMEQQS